MKVWEKCNEVKETDATIEQIADWAYGNRICPLMFDVGLEIDLPMGEDGYPIDNGNGFIKTAHKICAENDCGYDCLTAYLNAEYEEV